MSVLKTRWTDQVDMSTPLDDYPRPQLERNEWLNLNGSYDFEISDNFDSIPDNFSKKITVPFAPESYLSGLNITITENDYLWYRRTFILPDSYKNKNIILHFGAVDYECKVFVNRNLVSTHKGGYIPFEIDITNSISDGENELIIAAFDPTESYWQDRGKQVKNSKGFWYTATSGIWQTVWLEPVNKTYIKSLKLTPDIDNDSIRIQSDCSGNCEIRAIIKDKENIIFAGSISSDVTVNICNPHLWSPEDPFLYDVIIALCDESSSILDIVTSYFGMRKFSIGLDGHAIPRLLLNNKPYFFNGLLDQGYWPDGGMTAPTDDAMIFDIKAVKDLGYNMLRKHIKVEPLRWYYHCDRYGIVVWQDMVSGFEKSNIFLVGVLPNLFIRNIPDNKYSLFGVSDSECRNEHEENIYKTIDTLYNCTCIGCWIPFNEAWGQFDSVRIANDIKRFDNTRIVDHASGWHDQGGPDLKSVHQYILPVNNYKSKDRPYVLSEFGGYSRIIKNHVWNVEKSFGYVMFKSKKSLSDAYSRLFNKQILPKIAKGLSAVVYTQVSDVEFEVNGVFTYDRELLKIDEGVIKSINSKLKY